MSHIFKDTAHIRVIYGLYTGHIRDISKGSVKDAAIQCDGYAGGSGVEKPAYRVVAAEGSDL